MAVLAPGSHPEFIVSVSLTHHGKEAGLTPIESKTIALVWSGSLQNMATVMGDFREIALELVRDILDLADNVEAGIAQPEHVTNKTEEFIEILGLISALSNQDIDGRVTANLHEVLQQSIAEQRQTHGTGRPAFDIPIDVLEHHVLCGLTASEIATRFGVSERTIRRRMEQSSLRYLQLKS